MKHTKELQSKGVGKMTEATCGRCQGNGEIVLDWPKYLHPANLAEEESSVDDCPDCDGTGRAALKAGEK